MILSKRAWLKCHEKQSCRKAVKCAIVAKHSENRNPPLSLCQSKNHMTIKLYKRFAYIAAAVSAVVLFALVLNNVFVKKCNWDDWGKTSCLGTSWPATPESVSKIDVHGRDGQGNTPLHWAVETPLHLLATERPGRVLDVVETLIHAGANVNASNSNGDTPLHGAVLSNDLEIVTALIESGADVDARNRGGWTPLHQLTQPKEPNLGIFTALVNRGADVNVRTKGGYTPLHLLAEKKWAGDVTLATALIQAGADANARTKFGEFPLHLVAEKFYLNDIETIQVAMAILDGGANINARDGDDATPLHAVLCNSHAEPNGLAVFLVREGADVNARNDHGDSPLHCALRSPMHSIEVYDKELDDHILVELLKAGADVNAKNNEGQTPMDLFRLSRSSSDYFDVDLRLDLARRLYNINRNLHEGR
ncbi:MAG: hypothetical protein IBGAMO2_180003 [Arenicellales bacterium IbO2]|nr:MAG: hypothetical protein IBGAMO2_180003 [Arenicellales bacterium IbO2]